MVNRLDVHTFIYFELASSSIVLVRYRPQFSRQAYSFLEVNQRRLRTGVGIVTLHIGAIYI